MDKIIQVFEDKWVYDSSCDLDVNPPVIKRKKIRVLQEQIVEGASAPTYTIKYPDGKKYITSKNMYYGSQWLADQALLADLRDVLVEKMNQEADIAKEITQLRKVVAYFTATEGGE